MESRQVIGLTGALVLFIGVFTPIVSIPTVGYINYFQNEKIDGVVILSLALISFLLLLAKQYRGLWFTGLVSFAVLLFTFINLQIRISEIKDKLGVELAGSRPPGLADLVLRSVQIEWGVVSANHWSCFHCVGGGQQVRLSREKGRVPENPYFGSQASFLRSCHG